MMKSSRWNSNNDQLNKMSIKVKGPYQQNICLRLFVYIRKLLHRPRSGVSVKVMVFPHLTMYDNHGGVGVCRFAYRYVYALSLVDTR